jgi:hypothetical protein
MNQSENEFYENNIVYQKLRAFFDLGKEVYDFANDCTEYMPRWKDDGSLRADLYDLVSCFYFRTFKTFISVLLVCNKGHGEDGMSLARTIFDNYLTLRYIDEKPEDRIYKFKNYHLLEHKFMLERAKREDGRVRPAIKEVHQQNERKIEDNYSKVKTLYVKPGEDEKKCLVKFKSGKWAGVDKRQMAEILCLSYDYDYVFHFHSCFVHPHPYGLTGFREETDSELRYGAKPSDEWVFPALPVATRYFLRILEELFDTFHVDRSKPMQSLLSRLSHLENDYLKKQGFLQ